MLFSVRVDGRMPHPYPGRMKLCDMPDLTGPKNPKRLNIAISNEIHQALKKLKAMGKDGPEVVRKVLAKELAEILKDAG